MNKLSILVLIILLSSCDSYVSLSYVVKNKTSKPVKVFVPNYSGSDGFFRHQKDTILEIPPHDYERVGGTLPRISGLIRPAQKRMYKEQPGMCGLKLVKPDTMIELACTKKKWKFRQGCATLIIRK
jgi:hypothetical protein